MRSRLVRFERSHADDDEIVANKFGPYPGAEAYLNQLERELSDGGFGRMMSLVHSDMATLGCADMYRLYVRVDCPDQETSEQLAQNLQQAYDDGGAAGWFQVIE